MPASQGDRLSSQAAQHHDKPGRFPLDHRLLFALITAGGAAFPPILGFFARQTGSVANGYIVPLLGYLAVGLYGLIVRRKTVDSVPVHD